MATTSTPASTTPAQSSAQEMEKLRSGAIQIEVHYREEESYSGYTTDGKGAELLAEIRLATWLPEWGYVVDSDVVRALGEEFTYPEAVEFARPAMEARAAAKATLEAEIATKFAEAKQSGNKVIIRQWAENGDDFCDYAMPDGSRKIERHHIRQ